MIADRGYQYGPAFRGLTAMWRRGDELFAEVSVPEGAQRRRPGRASRCCWIRRCMRSCWPRARSRWRCRSRGRRWRCTRRARRAARVRIAPTGPSSVSIELADGLGLPVLSVGSMVARPVTPQQLQAAIGGNRAGELFEVSWSPSTEQRSDTGAADPEVVELAAVAPGTPSSAPTPRATTHWTRCRRALGRASDGPSLVVTRGAVALPGEDVGDLGAAAVWGLVRSAQTENPGRILLADVDGPVTEATVAAVLAAGEPQVVIRDGVAHIAAGTPEPGRRHSAQPATRRTVAAGDQRAGNIRKRCTAVYSGY